MVIDDHTSSGRLSRAAQRIPQCDSEADGQLDQTVNHIRVVLDDAPVPVSSRQFRLRIRGWRLEQLRLFAS